jgi:hypothetical protein
MVLRTRVARWLVAVVFLTIASLLLPSLFSSKVWRAGLVVRVDSPFIGGAHVGSGSARSGEDSAMTTSHNNYSNRKSGSRTKDNRSRRRGPAEATSGSCARLEAITSSLHPGDEAPPPPMTFNFDCDGKPLVVSAVPNTEVDSRRTCSLPQYGTTACQDLLGDGDCDVAQYSAGVIPGKGKKRKKSLLKRSPNLNCSAFHFDGGDCLVRAHQSGSSSSNNNNRSSSSASSSEPSSSPPAWVRRRQAKVQVAVPLSVDDDGSSGQAPTTTLVWFDCMLTMGPSIDVVADAGASNVVVTELSNPISTATGVRGRFLQ